MHEDRAPLSVQRYQKQDEGVIVIRGWVPPPPPPELVEPSPTLVTGWELVPLHLDGLVVLAPALPETEEAEAALARKRAFVSSVLSINHVILPLVEALQSRTNLFDLYVLSDPQAHVSLARLGVRLLTPLAEALARYAVVEDWPEDFLGAMKLVDKLNELLTDTLRRNAEALAAEGLWLARVLALPEDPKRAFEESVAFVDDLWIVPRDWRLRRPWKRAVIRYIMDYLKRWAGGPAADEEFWERLLEDVPPGKDVRDFLLGREWTGYTFPGLEEAVRALRGR